MSSPPNPPALVLPPINLAERLGTFDITSIGGERVRAFIPPRLPPVPPLDLGPMQHLLSQADQALGRLDGLASILPDKNLLLYMYVRKEAVLSSQIEGTQSSLSDLLRYEADEGFAGPLADVTEVSNYVAAMDHGLKRLNDGFPLSLRLLREIHGILLQRGRGASQAPGEFRRTQNWIGGSRPGNAIFVPPPPHEVQRCMGDLEIFLHTPSPDLPTLVKAGLAHVQFETIHPFLDGNGRLGRLLITLLLCEQNVLRDPLLYLSLYFKTHRRRYYELLQSVRETGNWERWLDFFLTGVVETATQAGEMARGILALLEADRQMIEAVGRPATSALRLHRQFQLTPWMSIASATAALKLSQPTIAAALRILTEVGIVRELTGRQRDRVFVYHRYLALLNEGTEPLLTTPNQI